MAEIIYARPNQLVVLTGWWRHVKLITHVDIVFLSSSGHLYWCPVDVGAFTQMRASAVVIPFMRAYYSPVCKDH